MVGQDSEPEAVFGSEEYEVDSERLESRHDSPLFFQRSGPGRFYPVSCSPNKNNNHIYGLIVLTIRIKNGHFQSMPGIVAPSGPFLSGLSL